MKFYDDERMRDVRRTFDAAVLKWPGVTTKEMMGCLCYFRGKKFFAFLVTHGIVVTKLSKADRSTLMRQAGSKAFEMSGRTASTWVQLPAKEERDIGPLLPYVRKSYEAASAR